jgi:phosphate transport system substrate-binding protein
MYRLHLLPIILLLQIVFLNSSFGAIAKILVDGSSSISPYVQPIAAKYAREKRVGVTVQINGSKVGYECAEKKICQIGMTSMELTPDESKDLLVSHLGIDGVAVVASRDVTVSNLTSLQVRDIFEAKIKNWKDAGGEDIAIDAWPRRESSSIRDYFNQKLKISGTAKLNVMGTNEEILNRLKLSKGAISYMSLGQAQIFNGKNLKILSVDGIDPSPENLRNGKYKIKRSFYLVRHKDYANDANVTDLIDTLMSSRQTSFTELGIVMP